MTAPLTGPLSDPWPAAVTGGSARNADRQAPLGIAVLLLPPLSMITLGAIVDPLLEANRQSEENYYDVTLVSLDGAPVTLTNGSKLPVNLALPMLLHCHAMIVASDAYLPDANEAAVLEQLRRLKWLGIAFGGTRGGTGWMASAGLLEDRRAAVHWEDMTLYRERFPNLIHCATLYEIDADRLTASSSRSTMDLLLYIIAQQISPQLADGVARALGLQRIRPGHEKQNVPATSRIAKHPEKLTEALLVMEANLEEPLTSDEIANCVGISRRQLERLFKQNLNTLPSKYYQVLRLERSHQLIVRTQKSIVQIGLSCGFSSGSHFATAYRAHFGITPREDRARATIASSVTPHHPVEETTTDHDRPA